MNPIQILQQFIQFAKQRYGNGFDPKQMSTRMLGQNYNSPQEAWDKMLESGKISQEQYNKYRNLI